ncbi:MAG: hypothetical protein MUC94_12470 [bacterium]|nr:hypothetical protein [bacterium]
MSAQALTNIRILERYIEKNKDDKIVSGTINKIIQFKIDKYKKELTELKKELSLFEAKYRMDSPHFLGDFEAGKLGDSIDFVEWSSLYKIHQRVLERKNILEGV